MDPKVSGKFLKKEVKRYWQSRSFSYNKSSGLFL